MIENENAVVDTEEFSGEAYSGDDWDDIDLADDSDADTENGGAEAEPGDHTGEAETEEPAEGEKEPEAEAQTDRFTLKHLDDVRTVSRDEVIALAQKGLDYDRIKGKLDGLDTAELREAQAELSELRAVAREQGMTVAEFADSMRAVMLAKKEGLSLERANERVKLARREAELQRREEALTRKAGEAEQADAAKKAAQEKRDRDIREFVAEYGGVDFKSIPQEVWADVSRGKGLVDAYRKHELRILKEELAAERKNTENAARSTGSRKGAGKTVQDDFTASWYADDD